MDKKNNISTVLQEIKRLLEYHGQGTKEILSFEQACLYLDLSASQLYKLTSSNSIEFFKPSGKKIYFKKADLDAWMLQNPQGSVNKAIEGIESSLRNRNSKKNPS
ncbi:MAG: helix-turn-helix domain-containing protein [Bacteroidota bacterium]|nr:helix-turn-helix domain-containing protein [Bacteroidota bacterium]